MIGDLAGEIQLAGRAVSFLGRVLLLGEGVVGRGPRLPMAMSGGGGGLASPLPFQKPNWPLGHRGAWPETQYLSQLGSSLGATPEDEEGLVSP